MGKGSVLLFHILQLVQSKETSWKKALLLALSKVEFNKNINVLELGCPNLLCHRWHLFE